VGEKKKNINIFLHFTILNMDINFEHYISDKSLNLKGGEMKAFDVQQQIPFT
jgi:hypothetical protein